MTIQFYVPGIPRPQGSKRIVRSKRGKTLLLEDNTKTAPWRDSVRWAAMSAMRDAGLRDHLALPLLVSVTFVFPRPKKPKHPVWVAVKPDVDKLLRALFDGLTSAVWVDDNQVVSVRAAKTYEGHSSWEVGAHVTITTIDEASRAAAA
jgi:crossover junction endodeoxyribonuclease RusA